MKYDIILAGVGGQGILTVAYLLDNAAVRRGWHFKQAEVHGMSQRGGAVYSHLRVSDGEIISDLVPEGRADLILAVEPLEVQRYLHFLGPQGYAVSNVQPFKNIPDYPDDQKVLDALLALPNTILFNAKEIALAAKSPRSENVATVGAAIPCMPFGVEDFDPVLEELFGRKGEEVVNANKAILRMGLQTGLLFKALREAAVPSNLIQLLIERLQPATVDALMAPAWAAALKEQPAVAKEKLASLTEKVPCTEETLRKLFA